MSNNKDICPKCRFPKRISGIVFVNNDIISTCKHLGIEKLRCPLCRHLPDYEIISIKPKQAKIIYRNFNGSKEYFKEVKNYLKENGIEVV